MDITFPMTNDYWAEAEYFEHFSPFTLIYTTGFAFSKVSELQFPCKKENLYLNLIVKTKA